MQVVDGLQFGSGEEVHLAPDIPVAELVNNRSIVLSCNGSQTDCVTLVNPASQIETQVDFAGFDPCVLWTPYEGAPFVYIEPWAGMTRTQSDDTDFKHKFGIQKIAPLHSKNYSIHLKLL